MDLSLEQAAADLYATPWNTFKRVTFPRMLPGILAGAMLAFVISLDDVVITLFVAGPGQETLPIYVIGQLRRIVSPEMNAVSSLFLLVSILLVSFFLSVKSRKKVGEYRHTLYQCHTNPEGGSRNENQNNINDYGRIDRPGVFPVPS